MAAYAIQFRRGTTTQHNSFTGLMGEVTVDTDKKTLVVHDGSTTGGFPLAREGANLASAEGSFTSNVSVGGTLQVTSTASFSDDVSITGDLSMTGHVIPSANITYDLGSTTHMWRDVYVGPGSLYINGQKVLEDNSGTIKMSADTNQNIKIESSGTGALQFVGAGGLQIQGEVNALTGDLQFGDHLDMNSNRIKEVSAPVEGADATNKTYVDSKISSSLSSGTLSFDGTTGNFSGDVEIDGSLTVAGTVTTVNSETIELADNILLLNSNASGSASQNGGIEVERGDDLNVQLLWDETNDRWTVGAEDVKAANFIGDLTGDVTGTVSSLSNHDTDDLVEGTSNLFYTSARVDSRFDVNWNLKDSDDLPEGTNNLFYTQARVETVFDSKMGADNSDSLSEGSTNLYFTDERAQDAALKNVVGGSNITVSYDENSNELTINGIEDDLSNNDTDDLAETATNRYWTPTRETAITTAYESYADSAVTSEATTRADADTALDGRLNTLEGADTVTGSVAKAEKDAKAYTDTRETAITTAYESYADTVETDAVATANTYTDGRETAITQAYTTAISTAVEGKDALSELSGSTDDVTEGTGNLYHTDARARAAISASGSLSYDSATGNMSFTMPAQNTTAIAEGDNLYHTTARARAAISASGSLSYDSATGEMSFTMPAQNTTAITEGDNLYYTDARADARVANATGTNLDISNQDTDELSEGSANLYFTDARAVAAVKSGMSMSHSGVYVVTTDDNTGNDNSSHAITAADLGFNVAGKEFYQVFLNRQLLRPTEYTVNGIKRYNYILIRCSSNRR